MKKICVILACSFMAGLSVCRAQIAGQFNTELGINYYSVEEEGTYYDMYGPSISLAGGVRFCDYLFAGVMTGLDLMIDQGKEENVGGVNLNTSWYRRYLVPVDLNLRGYVPLGTGNPLKIYLDVAAGPLLHYEKYYYVSGFNMKGLHLKTGIGVSYKKLSFTMGWESLQRQESIYLRAGISLGRYTR